MEVTASQVKHQLDSHEAHCEERHQTINSTLTHLSTEVTRLSGDVIRLTSDVENIKMILGDMQQGMHALRGEMTTLRGEMTTLRRDVDDKMEGLRREVRWTVGMGVGFLSLLVTVLNFIG